MLASDRETTLLLFLNLIDWLAGQRGDVPVLRTGESRPLDTSANEITALIDPRGRRIEIPKDPNPFLSFDRAGIYHLHHREGPPSLVLANFQDSSESTDRAKARAAVSSGIGATWPNTVATTTTACSIGSTSPPSPCWSASGLPPEG